MLVGLFLVSRLALLLFAVDAFSLFEEHHTGVAVRDLVRGLEMPLLAYQDMPHSGEVLFLALLGAPYFLLLGDTLLAVKLSAVTIHLLMLVAGYVLLDRFSGRVAAVAGGCLLILAPPSVVRTTLIPIYQHSEVLAFALLAYLLLLSVRADRNRPSWRFAVLGLVSGLAVYYSYTFAAPLGAMVVMACFSRVSRPSRGEGPLFGAFFLVGLSPHLLRTAELGQPPFSIHGRSALACFSSNSPQQTYHRLVFLLSSYLPDSLSYKSLWLAATFTAVCLLSLAIVCARTLAQRRGAWMVGPPGGRRLALAGLLLLHVSLYTLAVAASTFPLEATPDGSRYVVPLHVLVLLLAAVALQDCLDSRTTAGRGLATVLAATLGTAGLVTQIQLLSLGSRAKWAEAFLYVGGSDKVFDWLSAVKVGSLAATRPETAHALRQPHSYVFDEQLPPSLLAFGADRQRVLDRIATGNGRLALRYGGLGKTGDLDLVGELPEAYDAHFYESYGHELTRYVEIDRGFWETSPASYVGLLRRAVASGAPHVPEAYWPALAEGLGRGWNRSFTGEPAVYVDLVESLKPEWRRPFAIGLGRLAGWRYGPDMQKRLEPLDSLPEQIRAPLLVGLGWELAYDLSYDQISGNGLRRSLSAVPAGERLLVCRGLRLGTRIIRSDESGASPLSQATPLCRERAERHEGPLPQAVRRLQSLLVPGEATGPERLSTGPSAPSAPGVGR